ncbi:MAG TPA: proline--tRNA ligase, partial [Gemmatimonadota bacterium]|nr:proline--tRNA ligase [Gemmatimonadota bacterium]
MRWTRAFIPTLKEDPADAEVVSHRLMVRAGMLRPLARGVYSYLPLCQRVILKIDGIVREELDRIGAIELMLPILLPAELWRETGRWDLYGPLMMRLADRHEREYALGPTHEEIVTDLVRSEVRSYRQLPLSLYQIQTKFRDEIRPRFGVMRGREFTMKDAYSFHADEASLDATYGDFRDAYGRIFTRCGLAFRDVEASSGEIGGEENHEFMVLADTGESVVFSCQNCGYAASSGRAEIAPAAHELAPGHAARALEEVATPGRTTVEEVSGLLGRDPAEFVKTLLFQADGRTVAVLVRGDREVEEEKLGRALGVDRVEMAGPARVQEVTGAEIGFAGPHGLPDDVRVVADYSLAGRGDLVAGANRTGFHVTGLEIGRDVELDAWIDAVRLVGGDPCPRCGTALDETRGIEVGHIFKLGAKYSEPMNAVFLDEEGQQRPFLMGCYGLGITRVVAAAIEQNHDENGIVWPTAIAPYEVEVIPLNMDSPRVVEAAERIYDECRAAGLETLLDDRADRAGSKFADADLIGIPWRIVVGDRGLESGMVEVARRRARKDMARFSPEEAVHHVRANIVRER